MHYQRVLDIRAVILNISRSLKSSSSHIFTVQHKPDPLHVSKSNTVLPIRHYGYVSDHLLDVKSKRIFISAIKIS